MIKRFALLLGLGLCAVAFAVPQYVPDSVGVKGANNTAVTHDPTFIANSLYFNNSAQISVSMLQNNVSERWQSVTFGMYSIDRDTMAVQNIGTLNELVTAAQQTFRQVANAQQTIGFWVSNGALTLYSLNSMPGGGGTHSAFKVADGKFILGFTEGYFGSVANLPNSDLLFELSLKDAPAGQPLPGILATLLIAGGIIYIIRRRRKHG